MQQRRQPPRSRWSILQLSRLPQRPLRCQRPMVAAAERRAPALAKPVFQAEARRAADRLREVLSAAAQLGVAVWTVAARVAVETAEAEAGALPESGEVVVEAAGFAVPARRGAGQ